MLEYLTQRPYLIAILAVLAAFTLWVCYKAGKASARTHRRNEEIMKKLDEENRLRNEFAILTSRLIDGAEPERLVKGIGLNLYKRLENAPELVDAFNGLTACEQELYALYFALDESQSRLSDFFKANGRPLTCTANSLFSKLYPGEAAEIFEREFLAFDSEDEGTSFIPEQIKQLDERFAELSAKTDFYAPAAEYIRNNSDEFLHS